MNNNLAARKKGLETKTSGNLPTPGKHTQIQSKIVKASLGAVVKLTGVNVNATHDSTDRRIESNVYIWRDAEIWTSTLFSNKLDFVLFLFSFETRA